MNLKEVVADFFLDASGTAYYRGERNFERQLLGTRKITRERFDDELGRLVSKEKKERMMSVYLPIVLEIGAVAYTLYTAIIPEAVLVTGLAMQAVRTWSRQKQLQDIQFRHSSRLESITELHDYEFRRQLGINPPGSYLPPRQWNSGSE